MPWKTMDVQRTASAVCGSRQPAGEAVHARLCEEFGISRPTGYLMAASGIGEQGLAGIAERSRRPQHSPEQTAAEVEQRVVELRQRYPDWGARKLQVVAGSGTGVRSARSTVHRILLRHDLVRDEIGTQAVRRFERGAPNELWQMDFKSPMGWDAPIGPLSVLDDHSRYLLVLQAVGSTRAEPVREQLESAFQRCGVPEAMLMDHGTPWWNTKAAAGSDRV